MKSNKELINANSINGFSVITEVQAVQDMYDGVIALIEAEKELI